MSAPVIATVAFTDSTSDITSLLEVATYTTTATGWYQVQFFCSGLTATAANIDVFLRRYATGPGALLGEYGQSAIVKQTAAGTTWGNGFAPVFCNSGDILRVALKSSNAGDTTVNGTMEVWDASDANVRQVAGTAQTARDLGLALPAVAPGVAGGLKKETENVYYWIGDGVTNSYETLACYLLNGATPASLPVSGDKLIVDTATVGWVASSDTGTLADGVVATFNGSSLNNGAIEDNAVFNDSSVNTGAVGNNATFNDNSYNNSTVGDDATFNDSSYNSGTVGRNATFNDSSYNSGTAGDDAVINTGAAQTGAFSGSVLLRRPCDVSGATIAGSITYGYDNQADTATTAQAAAADALAAYNTTGVATAAAQPDIDTLTIDGVSKKVVKATTYGFMGALFDTVSTTFPAVMAAAFKKLFNIATPTNTVNDLSTYAGADTAGTTELLTRVANLSIATTTGNWGTAGTWLGGVVPSAGDNIIIRNGITVTIAADLDLGQFGTLELQGSGALEIAADKVVETVPVGWMVTTNYGTVTTNYGTVTENSTGGTVTLNNGTVTSNEGMISTSSGIGTVKTNIGTIATNAGTVTRNYGMVGNNNSNVTNNYSGGTVTANIAGGMVTNNVGTVTTNNAGSTVFGGTVTTNNGNWFKHQTGDCFPGQPAIDTIDGTKYAKATTYGFMGTLLTGTAALIVAAWQKLFNIATPANTVNDLATAENVTDASSKGEAATSATAIESYGDSHWTTATQTEATNMPADGDFLSDEQKAELTAAAAASGLDAAGVRLALGMASANLDSQLATLGGNTGSGAYTITVTVNDGTDGIEGAKVRYTKGAESYIGTANVSGVVPFGLDAGTWSVAITAPGYAFTPTTLVVSATAPVTYSMTQVTIPASDPGFVTGYIYCYDQDGVLEEGALVQMRFSDLAGTGHSYDTAIRTAISDAAGVVTFSNLVPGATYLARRGTETDWVDIEISADAEDPVALGNLFGEDS